MLQGLGERQGLAGGSKPAPRDAKGEATTAPGNSTHLGRGLQLSTCEAPHLAHGSSQPSLSSRGSRLPEALGGFPRTLAFFAMTPCLGSLIKRSSNGLHAAGESISMTLPPAFAVHRGVIILHLHYCHTERSQPKQASALLGSAQAQSSKLGPCKPEL